MSSLPKDYPFVILNKQAKDSGERYFRGAFSGIARKQIEKVSKNFVGLLGRDGKWYRSVSGRKG